MKVRGCELCNGEAALFCSSDSAFLCWNCDAKVHEANFLVARHLRRTVCSKCKGFTGNRISGVGYRPFREICRSCPPDSPGDDLDALSSSSSSACISSTESRATPPKKLHFERRKTDRFVSSNSTKKNVSGPCSKVQGEFPGEVTSGTTRKSDVKSKTRRSQAPSNVYSKAESILVYWFRKLGLSGEAPAVHMASRAFGVCLDEFPVLPFRTCLAASLWFSLRLCGDRSPPTWQILKSLEQISAVPGRLILAAESKLARVSQMRKPSHRQQEEGWDECSA